MTPTEIFKLFLKHGLDPYERRAIALELKKRIYLNDDVLCKQIYYGEMIDRRDIEREFAERLMVISRIARNTCGTYGEWSYCYSLSSFMRYLLYYVPSIIGNAKNKNKYLEMANVEIPKNMGYKHYWERKFINKWHTFLKEHVRGYDRYVASMSSMEKYELKDDIRL